MIDKKHIASQGMEAPALSIEYEQQAYLKLGRIEKADILWNWIRTNHKDYAIWCKEIS